MPTPALYSPPTTASAWIEQWSHLVEKGGAVLDVAAGNGRHSRFFASRGHDVLALDRDETALASLAAVQHVSTRCADLENAAWPLREDEKFAAVVVTNYLHRPLFPFLLDALAPGGVLLYETFAAGNAQFGKPSNPDFLLNPGELLDAVRPRLRVIAYQDGFISAPRASCVQRICAVAGPAPLSTGLTDRNNAAPPDRYVLQS
ncbi:SAM-dependent methyltransferase [Burkholderia sp. PAMC 28687]|uniref:Putative SAM-dependent methyltransferase Bucepa02006346 n=1 Tax=Caballeronia sordidicola TaxID=196367 RepID=A0A242NBX6_CABSO|nr:MULTISPECIES: class I SAM-dependent methyltransferase [Burkholderiaceae]AMM13603.1 SAM-dependent methyltransferase [Burkholderia sp. PAMC 28687]OTP80700.1 putative SAM-dependent methyltransferase Bucepa02006346 [Caballeronia sordidicola]